MARLNEASTSSESLESLKRRFVRQNREIARANSIQSVKVRDLEAEVSRLLAENVSLREEVISLHQELEKYEGSERVDVGISGIKDKLEAKLAEVSSIVTDLGALPRRRPNGISQPFRDNAEHPVSPTNVGGASNTRVTRDIALGSDLPVIMEDKLYPRLSLESDGEVDPANDAEEQQDDDPITYDPPISPELPRAISPSEDMSTTDEVDDNDFAHLPDSPPSLEIRKKRKRRDSSLLKDIIPKSDFGSTHESSNNSPQIPKAGSKRKFSVSQDEPPVSALRNDDPDGFQFTRVTEKPSQPARDTESSPEKLGSRPSSKKAGVPPKKNEKTKPARRALEPKTANVDLKSPMKKKANPKNPAGEKDQPKGALPEKPKRPSKTAVIDSFTQPDQDERNSVDIHLDEEIGKTIGEVENVFSHETSTAFPSPQAGHSLSESKDSHPPEVQTSLDNGKQSDKMRHSRRSRGPVSYAEPNLRVKMRRPSNDPIDAIEGPRRVSKSHINTGSKSSGQQETDASDGRVPDPLEEDSAGKAASENRTGDVSPGQSPSSVVISTLVASTKKPSQHTRPDAAKFDPGPQQAPADSFDQTTIFSDALEDPNVQSTIRQSRRHSSNQSNLSGGPSNRPYKGTGHDSQGSLEPKVTHMRNEGGRAQRLGTRRRTTMV